MSDLTQMTQTALKSASKGASKATSKDGALSDPKTLAVAGVGLAALPLAVEQIAKRVAPKVSDVGEQAKEKVSDAASGAVSTLGDQAKEAAKGAVVSKLTPGSSGDEGEGLLSKLKPGSSDAEGGDKGEGLLSKLKPGSSDSDDDDEHGRAAPGQGGERTANADPAVGRRGGADRGRLQPLDLVRGLARVHAPGRERRPGRRHDALLLDQDLGDHEAVRGEIVEQRPDERIEWNVHRGCLPTPAWSPSTSSANA